MIIGSVPLYNVMAVIVLSFFHPERKAIDKAVWMKTLNGDKYWRNVHTNGADGNGSYL